MSDAVTPAAARQVVARLEAELVHLDRLVDLGPTLAPGDRNPDAAATEPPD